MKKLTADMFESRKALLIGMQDYSELRNRTGKEEYFDVTNVDTDFFGVIEGLKELGFEDD